MKFVMVTYSKHSCKPCIRTIAMERWTYSYVADRRDSLLTYNMNSNMLDKHFRIADQLKSSNPGLFLTIGASEYLGISSPLI